MSTRSNIAIKRKNEKVKTIYCHWDGYLSYNGDILLHHYQDINKINELINLGDISSLNKKVKPTKEHTFDEPQKGVVVAYGRDRGETNVEPVEFNNLQDYLRSVDKLFIEYIYLYDEEKRKWFYTNKTYKYYKSGKEMSMKDFKELTEKEILKEKEEENQS